MSGKRGKGLSADYYERNPLTEIQELRRRIAALERAQTAQPAYGSRLQSLTDTTPDALLPKPADIRPLFLIDEETRTVWRLAARRAADGRELLDLRYVGRLRGDVNLPGEGGVQ